MKEQQQMTGEVETTPANGHARVPSTDANAPTGANAVKGASTSDESNPNPITSSDLRSQTQGVTSRGGWASTFTLLGGLWEFSMRFVRTLSRPPYEFREIIRQLFAIGYRSLSLVTVVGIVIGAVLTMQSRPTMTKFGAEAFIPAMVAISVMRELSPVLISVILAGRVGAGIAAELGSMRATEQIDAMDVAALDPYKLLVFTRVVACMIALPVLCIYADFLALVGSWLVEKLDAGMSVSLFINSVTDSVEFSDYLPGIAKTIFFGFTIGIVGCYEGYNSTGGTEGVGKSATDAAVTSSLLIILLDVLFVKVTLMLWPS
jgi:phospholipid/cholesterol/gamma-HCH transport system permease protein